MLAQTEASTPSDMIPTCSRHCSKSETWSSDESSGKGVMGDHEIGVPVTFIVPPLDEPK